MISLGGIDFWRAHVRGERSFTLICGTVLWLRCGLRAFGNGCACVYDLPLRLSQPSRQRMV